MSRETIRTTAVHNIATNGGQVVLSRLIRYSPLFALALVWEVAGWAGILPQYIPAFSTVVAELGSRLIAGDMNVHTSTSLQRVYVGFFGGSALGILVGILAGRSTLIATLFDPVVSSTYPVPKIAIYPLLMVWLGIGFWSTTAVIFLAAFYPVYISTYDGARSVDKLHIWSAKNFNASRIEVLLKVVLPNCLTQIFSGLRVSLAISFIVLFAAELIASRSGLGHLVMMADRGNNYPLMFAAIAMIAILGFLHDRLLNAVRSRALYWERNTGGI